MLTPEQYQALLERIDLDFAASNQENFEVDEKVELELFTKNVDKLIVKVFEINTQNFYRKFQKEVDTDIALDGLVANDEQLYEYTDSPLLRKSRKFKFEKLDKRGVYIVDFIGGGKSSRALIRKGKLQLVGRVTPAGQRFNVVNESGSLATDASLSIGGRNYSADENGNINIPFSTQSTSDFAIVTQGNFSSLQLFQPVAEKYSLTAAFHVDRESLSQSNEATVLIRPSLSIKGGNPIPLSRLNICKLEITSTTIEGVTSTKTIGALAVSEMKEATATFLVPPRLGSISFRLEAKLTTLLKQEIELSATDTFAVNEIDTTDEIQDLHLLPTNAGWFLEVLGKTGERRAGQPVRFRFGIAGIKTTVDIDLQSDEKGQIELGSLINVDWLEATTAGGSTRRWNPNPHQMYLATNYHLLSGDELNVPLPTANLELDPRLITLLETRGNRNVRDCYSKLKIEDQRLQISDLEPGDYKLTIRSSMLDDSSRKINIRVTSGLETGEFLVGEHRILQKNNPTQPFATAAAIDGKNLSIKIADATKSTRVHVFPVRYLNAFDPFVDLGSIRRPEPWQLTPAFQKSAYMAGRKIGEEYQYILNRRYAARFPGNMLERPSLLMNPWAVQDTQSVAQVALDGDAPAEAGVDRMQAAQRGRKGKRTGTKKSSFANLDFLDGGEHEILNVIPNDDGIIELTAEQIGNAQAIRIVVVDLFSVSQSQILRQPSDFKAQDQRLANAIDPKKHYRQARQIEVLNAGDSLVIEDILSAEFQQYDELSDVFSLYSGLGNDRSKLQKFSFVLDWLNKSDEEKRDLYSEHACHELNFFIFNKDEAFFDAVVQPHLLNKRERTFMDLWLLEEDVSQWLEPWRFARLNVVEKILLSQRHEERRADLARHISELYELAPTPRSRYDQLYRFGLMTNSLDDDLSRGIRAKRRSLSELSRFDGIEQRQLLAAEMNVADTEEESRFSKSFAVPTLAAPTQSPSISVPDGGTMLLGGIRRGGRSIQPGKEAMLLERKKSQPRSRVESRTRMKDGEEFAFEVQVPETENLDLFVAGQTNAGAQLYRRIEPTQEWIENNYYELLPTDQSADLVRVNQFWNDYAQHKGGTFASQWFAEANSNFTEMMFALAVLDLPLTDVKENVAMEDRKLTITAEGPMIVLHQQNEESEFDRGGTTVFVSENFYQSSDRYRYEEGIKFDKFVSGNFLANLLYGAEVVITNPTSTPMAIEVLVQIPGGAMPVDGSWQTRTISMQLDAFSTEKVEYSFYFPAAGDFTHYPAHVSSDVKVLAVAENREFAVVDEAPSIDKTSWEWVSQNGSDNDVVEFLRSENIQRIDPQEIAFRMKDRAFFNRTLVTLRDRCRYDHTLWSYSVKHNDEQAIREFLEHSAPVTSQCGASFESELLRIDPFTRNWFEQREFSPLVNSRAHQLGAQRKILNSRVHEQYEKLMNILGHRAKLDSDNRLVVTYYLLLQDRIEEAMHQFAMIDAESIIKTMPYAYCDAYLDLYREKPEDALAKAQRWTEYPVDRWRNRFKNIESMVKEINGEKSNLVDEKDRNQQQDLLASNAPGFEFSIDSDTKSRGRGKGTIQWRNIRKLTINYYEMDIEFLFSSNPFARDQVDGFSMIRPNLSQAVSLDEGAGMGKHEFMLPEQFNNKNVLVEVIAGDSSKSKTWYANSMEVQVIESYGQVLLSNVETKKPISKAYVKVFSKGANGNAEFHKDGYTDLRGRFDFVTQSNRSLDGISEYAILIISDDHGAVIREAKPPRE